MRRRSRSISLPIILASVSLALSIAMLIGWTLVILQNLALTRSVAQNTTLLVAGIVSFAIIMSALVMLCVFLVAALVEVRRQNSFIDSVTHELKTPLASLKLGLETIARADLAEAQRSQMRQLMTDSVERLAVFIDDILEASHLAHGRAGHSLQEISLADVVERVRQAVTARYRTAEGAIRVDVPPSLRFLSDSVAVETVLKNLLDNAVKYSAPPVDVHVRATQPEPNRVIIEVTDNGIGVPKRHLKRIFDRFFRVPDEEVRSRHGTGLGLFVVSALVRNLGGRIEARSDGPGRGTTMSVSLPIEQRTQRSAPA